MDCDCSVCGFWAKTTHLSVQSGQTWTQHTNRRAALLCIRKEFERVEFFFSGQPYVKMISCHSQACFRKHFSNVSPSCVFPSTQKEIFELRHRPPKTYTSGPLTTYSIYFCLLPLTLATEVVKVAFTVNHLTGRARLWGTAKWKMKNALSASEIFATELRKVFGQSSFSTDTGVLMTRHQGNQSADIPIRFSSKACQRTLNDGALPQGRVKRIIKGSSWYRTPSQVLLMMSYLVSQQWPPNPNLPGRERDAHNRSYGSWPCSNRYTLWQTQATAEIMSSSVKLTYMSRASLAP